MEQDKATSSSIKQEDSTMFALLSNYLNHKPDFISQEEISQIVTYGVSGDYAFSVLFAAALGLDIADNTGDADLFNKYFKQMTHKLDVGGYYNNPYFKNIKIPAITIGNSELKYEKYKPYEVFVCNDIVTTPEGRQIPQIGYFEAEFIFPAILENNRIWMTITPNEIETMHEPVDGAFGNVLTFGLGLGYYAYMISEKDSVERITIVDSNAEIIRIFRTYILPQFRNAHKITIIQGDAFEYAQEQMPKERYDFVFTDLWHDVSDGLDMYLRMKEHEQHNPLAVFSYWIEKSIRCYL